MCFKEQQTVILLIIPTVSVSTDTSGSVLQPPCALSTDDTDLCDTEMELSLSDEEYEEEVFTFSSCPHSARRNQASSNPVEDLTFGLNGHKTVSEGERKDARLEDDFVGSESEEVKYRLADTFKQQIHPVGLTV